MSAIFFAWLTPAPALLALALLAWAIATARRNAGLVDIFWPLFFLLGAIVCAALAEAPGARAFLVLLLVAAWALRLATHLALRNWNAPEDHRYRAIRARNEPGFAWKSLYLVFGLQAVLAWLILAPVAAAIDAPIPLGGLGLAGVALAAFGATFEAIADAQLARFKADAANRGGVMDEGLWRYSRHPNYFGEVVLWCGLSLPALGAGAWWTLVGPALITFLLLRVSGVTLLERGLRTSSPGYEEYARRTSAFIPWPPKTEATR
jgi:steroid 5-alpha reductase family enzyme